MKEGKLENRKGKEGLPQMGPTHRGSPAQGQGRLLPRASQAAAAVASMPATPGHLLLPRGHLLTPGDSQTPSRSIPPLPPVPSPPSTSFPLSSLARIVTARGARRSAVEPRVAIDAEKPPEPVHR